MIHTDCTKKILNIEDENIYFYEDCLKVEKINGIVKLKLPKFVL